MTTRLFPHTQPRKTLVIKNDGKSKTSQDTPKEDYIYCINCEKRIEVLETIFAQKIRDLHNYNDLPSKFHHIIIGQKEYLECKDIDPLLFKLFIYSIIWRLSISNLSEFKTLKLSIEDEEELRKFLDNNLAETHTLFKERLLKINLVPQFHICFIKPKERMFPSGGILSAYSYSEKLHLVMLVEFALFFITDDQTINSELATYSNKGKNIVIVALTDNELWKEFNKSLVNQMLNSKNTN